MVNEVSNPGSRRRMLQEVLRHVEAINKAQWEWPPVEPGHHGSSYAEMRLDPTVNYCIGVITTSILAEGYQIAPADEKDRGALAMAAAIKDNLDAIDLESHLDDALDAVWRGFNAQEIVWEYGSRKRFWLKDLAQLSADQMAFTVDDMMRVTQIRSRPLIGGTPYQVVPTGKAWLHVHEQSRSKPAGESILEPAWRAWNSKNRLLQFWGLSLQRFGSPQWKVTIPATTPPEKQSTILSTFQNGRLDGVYMVPEDCTAEVVNPTQWANLTYEAAVDFQDGEMVKAMLLFATPGGQRGITHVTGSSLEVLNRSTTHMLARMSRELCASLNRQVIQPLCMANWAAQPAQCPRLILPIPDPARIAAMAASWQALVTAGIADREVAAQQLGLPEPTCPDPAQAKLAAKEPTK
jgi:phage gp29-like protein